MSVEASPSVSLSFLVLRAKEARRLAEFYSVLGLNFVKEKHGEGPAHFSTQCGESVLEIYPARQGTSGTSALRLGFNVDSIDELAQVLSAQGAELVVKPHGSPWGRCAVYRDPEGHTFELHEKAQCSTV